MDFGKDKMCCENCNHLECDTYCDDRFNEYEIYRCGLDGTKYLSPIDSTVCKDWVSEGV